MDHTRIYSMNDLIDGFVCEFEQRDYYCLLLVQVLGVVAFIALQSVRFIFCAHFVAMGFSFELRLLLAFRYPSQYCF